MLKEYSEIVIGYNVRSGNVGEAKAAADQAVEKAKRLKGSDSIHLTAEPIEKILAEDSVENLGGKAVIVGGGDGTGNWALDALSRRSSEKKPDIAFAGLGTKSFFSEHTVGLKQMFESHADYLVRIAQGIARGTLHTKNFTAGTFETDGLSNPHPWWWLVSPQGTFNYPLLEGMEAHRYGVKTFLRDFAAAVHAAKMMSGELAEVRTSHNGTVTTALESAFVQEVPIYGDVPVEPVPALIHLAPGKTEMGMRAVPLVLFEYAGAKFHRLRKAQEPYESQLGMIKIEPIAPGENVVFQRNKDNSLIMVDSEKRKRRWDRLTAQPHSSHLTMTVFTF
jgi:hypothetical protein